MLDIYKKLDIELYVNPKTQKIIFPNNTQIQSKLNLYLDSIDFNTKSPKIGNNQDEKLISSQLALALSGKHYTEALYHQHIKPNRFS